LSVELTGPLDDNSSAARAVIDELVGQRETAGEVERRLHRFADPWFALVCIQQLNCDSVTLTAQARLQGNDQVVQGRVGAGGNPQLQRGGEQRAEKEVNDQLHHCLGADGVVPRGDRLRSSAKLANPLGTNVFHSGGHQIAPAGEVVQLCAA
jgi:hypothetical protein